MVSMIRRILLEILSIQTTFRTMMSQQRGTQELGSHITMLITPLMADRWRQGVQGPIRGPETVEVVIKIL